MLWTLEKRHRLQIPDRYGNVPDAPRQDVTLADGRRGRITMERDGGWHLEIFPSRSEAHDGSINIRVSADEEEAYLKTARERFERDNPGFTWEVRRREVEPHEPVDTSFLFSTSMTLWPRFAVKVASNVGREIYGLPWLESPHGKLLHRLLWDEETSVRMQPWPTASIPWGGLGYEPGPDHVLCAMRGLQGPMLMLVLFGEQTYGVPLGNQPLDEEAVWLLHVDERTYERTTGEDFFGRIISSLPRGR